MKYACIEGGWVKMKRRNLKSVILIIFGMIITLFSFAVIRTYTPQYEVEEKFPREEFLSSGIVDFTGEYEVYRDENEQSREPADVEEILSMLNELVEERRYSMESNFIEEPLAEEQVYPDNMTASQIENAGERLTSGIGISEDESKRFQQIIYEEGR